MIYDNGSTVNDADATDIGAFELQFAMLEANGIGASGDMPFELLTRRFEVAHTV